jgi:hypothetical protein
VADEADLSYQRQFWRESSLRVAYIRKMVRDVYANFNVARDGQFTVPLATTVTLRSVDATAGTITQIFNLLDIPAPLRGVVRNQFRRLLEAQRAAAEHRQHQRVRHRSARHRLLPEREPGGVESTAKLELAGAHRRPL